MVTSPHTGTSVHEIAEGIYRNQHADRFSEWPGLQLQPYLVLDDEPLLFPPVRANCSRWSAQRSAR
jgi:hypothetical protein